MRTEIVTALKRQATRLLSELEKSKEPILITRHGVPSAYLVDAETYETQQRRMSLLEGIARGEGCRRRSHFFPCASQKAHGQMAEIIWTEPALADMDAIADYIALDNPEAARRLVQKVFRHMRQLSDHRKSSSKPPELKGWRHRQIVEPHVEFSAVKTDRMFTFFMSCEVRCCSIGYQCSRPQFGVTEGKRSRETGVLLGILPLPHGTLRARYYKRWTMMNPNPTPNVA